MDISAWYEPGAGERDPAYLVLFTYPRGIDLTPGIIAPVTRVPVRITQNGMAEVSCTQNSSAFQSFTSGQNQAATAFAKHFHRGAGLIWGALDEQSVT